MRRFAISDIHGCARTFSALLETIGLTMADELYLLGDYVDRGPDSRGVIDRIWELSRQGYSVHCLMGNHEQMMINSPFDREWHNTWTSNGGAETVRSFGAPTLFGIPEEYLVWAAGLPMILLCDEFILVHAGLDFSEADPLKANPLMLWKRDWYEEIDYDWLGERIILHGHTPIQRRRMEYLYQNIDEFRVLDIDCGCVFHHRAAAGLGLLCAFDMTNRRLFFQPYQEG